MLREQAGKTLKLSLPIIFGELAQMALHLIDAAMVGSIGYKQLAAAALVFNVVNIPFVLGIGMTVAVSQMVSMARGKEDDGLVSHYFYNGFWLAAVFAFLIAGALVFGKNLLFYLNQDPEVVAYAVPFMDLVSWSLVPALLFMALKQFADGLELTRVAMIISIAALPVNVFINWLLIFGNWGFPRLELVGAGWGTLITRLLIFAALATIVLRYPAFRKYTAGKREQWKIRGATWRELLRVGVPSGLQMGMEVGAFGASAIIIGMIDAVSLAAHQVAIGCASFTFLAAAGLSHGGSIRASNNFGRSDWRTISAIGKSTLLMALLWGTVCAVVFMLFRRQLAAAFTDEPPVIVLATTLLLLAALFQISDSLQAVAAGLLRGIKDVKIPTVLITVAYWVVGLPAGYLLTFHFKMGAVGMWLGFIIGLTFSAVFLIVRFLKITNRRCRDAYNI